MKLLYTPDLHIRDTTPKCRSDNFFDIQFEKLEEASSVITSNKIDYWLWGGDLFDKAEPSLELVNRLTVFLKKIQVPIISIIGSHDMVGYNVDTVMTRPVTALGNLYINGHIKVLNNTRNSLTKLTSNGIVYLKGIHARKDILLSDYKINREKEITIIMSHDPIVETPVIFEHVLIKDVAQKCNADIVLCSHVHTQFDVVSNGVRFINPGPMSRQEATEIGIEPKFCIVEV